MPLPPSRNPRPLRAPLVIPCLSIAAGIAASRWGQLRLREALAALSVLVVLGLLSRLRRDRSAAALALWSAFAPAGALLEIWRRPGPAPTINAAPRQTLVATGCIVEPPAFFAAPPNPVGADAQPPRVRFTLELRPGVRAQMSVYPRRGEPPLDLRYGDRIEIAARFRAIHNYGNPGAFDAEAYFARRGIYWNGSATGRDSVRLWGTGCGTPWRAWIYSLRGTLLQRIEQLFGPGTVTAGTLRALLIGDATRLDENDAESYRRAGVYHVLVVSGLHLAAIGAILLFFLRVARAGVTAALLWTVAVAWLYALLCGGAAPVVRAAAGLSLYALGRWFYRRPQVLNLLAAIALAYLVNDPGQLFEASFQLSFLAVALIGGLASPVLQATFGRFSQALRDIASSSADFANGPRLAEWRVELRLLAAALAGFTRLPERLWLGAFTLTGRFAAWVAEAGIVTLAVQMGMALPMVAYFHRFPLLGLAANLTVAPLMTAAVPAGLLAVATNAHWLARPVAWAVMQSQAIADWHARVETATGGAASRIPAPPVWVAIAFAASVAWLAVEARQNTRRRIVAAVTFAALLALLLFHPFAPRLTSGRLELTVIDVGQGDSLLAVSPGGSTLLIDTGGMPTFGSDRAPSFDVGEEVVSPYLWSRSIRHIDVVAITHPDADHAGGVRAVLENFRPTELWLGAELSDETLAFAKQLGVTIRRPRRGEGFDWDGATVDVLGPPAEDYGEKTNNRSLILRFSYGRHSFLLTGDVERAAEYSLLDSGLLANTTVLKVAHHGSRTSTVPEFLAAVRPAIALVSVGRDNTYGHPHPDVVKRLESATRHILRTDRLGQVTVSTNGRYLELSAAVNDSGAIHGK